MSNRWVLQEEEPPQEEGQAVGQLPTDSEADAAEEAMNTPGCANPLVGHPGQPATDLRAVVAQLPATQSNSQSQDSIALQPGLASSSRSRSSIAINNENDRRRSQRAVYWWPGWPGPPRTAEAASDPKQHGNAQWAVEQLDEKPDEKEQLPLPWGGMMLYKWHSNCSKHR